MSFWHPIHHLCILSPVMSLHCPPTCTPFSIQSSPARSPWRRCTAQWRQRTVTTAVRPTSRVSAGIVCKGTPSGPVWGQVTGAAMNPHAKVYLTPGPHYCIKKSMLPITLRAEMYGRLLNINSGLILSLRPVNERRRYKVTPSLIGWAQTWNHLC